MIKYKKNILKPLPKVHEVELESDKTNKFLTDTIIFESSNINTSSNSLLKNNKRVIKLDKNFLKLYKREQVVSSRLNENETEHLKYLINKYGFKSKSECIRTLIEVVYLRECLK